MRVVLGDATDTGLARGAYDLAHIRLLLVNVPDPAAVLREAVAIVRPSGTVAVQEVDWLSWQCEPALPEWTALRDVLMRLWHSRGLDPASGGACRRCCGRPGSARSRRWPRPASTAPASPTSGCC